MERHIRDLRQVFLNNKKIKQKQNKKDNMKIQSILLQQTQRSPIWKLKLAEIGEKSPDLTDRS